MSSASISNEARDYVVMAHRARSALLETQSARWVILTEQGETEAAKDLGSVTLNFAPRNEWVEARETANASVRAIRQKLNGMETESVPWARSRLDQYAGYAGAEKYWRTTAELLIEEATSHVETYEALMEAIVGVEGRSKTPIQLDRTLMKMGLVSHLNYIEALMVIKGLWKPAAPTNNNTLEGAATPGLTPISSPKVASEQGDTHFALVTAPGNRKKTFREWLNSMFSAKGSNSLLEASRTSERSNTQSQLVTDRDLREIPLGGSL